MSLNKSQAKAARHGAGPMLVLAGPGSGKTRVITERTKYLIANQGIDPSHILVITERPLSPQQSWGEQSEQ